MSNILKKIIIIIFVICILIIALLCIIMLQNDDNVYINYDNDIYSYYGDPNIAENNIIEVEPNKVKRIGIKSDFYLAEDCIEKFYTIKNEEQILAMLDEEYVILFNITEENVQNEIKGYGNIDIDITNMYLVQLNTGVDTYLVYGYIIDNTTSNIEQLAIGVKIDKSDRTFSILPYKYLEQNEYLNIEEGQILNLAETEQIENKKYNTYKYNYVNDEKHVKNLLRSYINRALYNTELAYKCLELEYSTKKFGDIQNYINYIIANKDLYLSHDMKNVKQPEDFATIDEYSAYMETYEYLQVKSYQKTTEDNYTQYVCIDNFGNYYIFRETSPMQYTVILDTYTIDLPEFTQKYEIETTEEKVLMNIQRFFDAINNGDYKYAYSKLDETFKANNFNTLENFENYVKTNFFQNNKLAGGNPKKQDDIYLYDITITDNSGKSNDNIKKTFVMQLKEGTDFVMSFSV